MTKIMKKMKEEKLFAPQGGPIILAQVDKPLLIYLPYIYMYVYIYRLNDQTLIYI